MTRPPTTTGGPATRVPACCHRIRETFTCHLGALHYSEHYFKEVKMSALALLKMVGLRVAGQRDARLETAFASARFLAAALGTPPLRASPFADPSAQFADL